MASKNETPVLNFLRAANIVTYPVAFTLSIAHAATSHDGLFPAIALVPQTASALFSGAILYFGKLRREHRHVEFDDGSENKRRRVRNATAFVGDVILAASLMTCMVFTWLHREARQYYQYYYSNLEITILGTYATVPFIINMTIHIFFALRAIFLSLPREWMDAFRAAPATCPHCHHNLGSSPAIAAGTHPVWLDRNGARYSMLDPEENDSLYRDIARQTGKADLEDDAERGEGARKPSEETAREIAIADVAKIVDV